MNVSKQLQWYKDQDKEDKKQRKSQKNTFIDDYQFLSKTFGKSSTLNNKKTQSYLITPNNNSTQKHKKKQWNDNNIPYSSQEILLYYSHYLTKHQKIQIKNYKEIYYLGHKIKKNQLPTTYTLQIPNYDTQEEKQYKYVLNDHIAYKYQIIEFLGKGSYGQVLKVFDHKKKQFLAMKIIRNKKKITKQAYIQINILATIKQRDKQGSSGIVKMKDFMQFRKHICIVFQLLHQNLYDLLKANQYNGLEIQLIRRFAIQILNSLKFLKENRIIHCDLKPQNILLKQSNKSGIKIIDFGSSCFENQILYSYIQSRYYRAPQITLNIKYNQMIDMWSFGCILIQLYLGSPIFPGQNQFEQMSYMIKTLGLPPTKLLDYAIRKDIFFNEDMTFTQEMNKAKLIPGFGYPLKDLIQQQDHLFLQFIQSILQWQPQKRLTPQEALKNKWILQGLPQQIKNVHKLFNQQKKYYPPPPPQKSLLKSKEKSKQKSRQKQIPLSLQLQSKSSKNDSKEISLKLKEILKLQTADENSNNNHNNSSSLPKKKKFNLTLKLKSLRPDIPHQVNFKIQQNQDTKNQK